MINVVLAAGYATRLGELTKNFPKPLLKIGNNTILGRMLDDIDTIDENDGLNAIAAIISDMSDMGADNDSMYDTMMPSNDYSTSDDSMPDYVSDADTADII